MGPIYHNSRETQYRSPTGAQPVGGRVLLRLRAPEGSAWLRTWWQNAERRLPMVRAGDFWECELTLPETPGLLWYFFIVETPEGSVRYGNAADRLGGEGALWPGEPASFQLTVYDRGYHTPEWMRGGIMYQIMVDRFRASRPMRDRVKPETGHLHAAWEEPPELRIDAMSYDNQADDFFGGDLRGIIEKIGYLKDLGISALYLNPIFRARSNHKYDTGDYMQIDPSFGDSQDFRALCAAAGQAGIRVVLDGVFSHTGSDSRYFNRFARYDSVGAYQSLDSPYASWYAFRRWPDEYDCWWGFQTLPNVREMQGEYLDFIIRGERAVVTYWIGQGASGWRLDVADELPMEFLRMLRRRVKAQDNQAAIIGEVWEDASNKVTYGELRSYCLGDTLDAAMNYPLRGALMDFMLARMDAGRVKRIVDAMAENYAPEFFYSMMNMLGSHDRPRTINMLAGVEDDACPREKRAAYSMTPSRYALGRARLIALWRFVCALPGMPCLYYGDEAGAQGGGDPFCRGTYPWGREDGGLAEAVREVNSIRRASAALTVGGCRLIASDEHVLVAVRWTDAGEWAICALNRADHPRTAQIAPEQAPELHLSAPVKIPLAPWSSRTLLHEDHSYQSIS